MTTIPSRVYGAIAKVSVFWIVFFSAWGFMPGSRDAVEFPIAIGPPAARASSDQIPDKAQEIKWDELVIWPHEKSDLAPDPALEFGRLKNGFRYVLMKNKEPRDRVSMHLDIQAGSLNERNDERGLAHFLEHMMFNGTTHYPPGELVKYFQNIGMQFGPDANAHTSFDETVYDILLPNGSPAQIKDALFVMRDFAAGASLLKDEIDRECNVILAEKRARDSADFRTMKETLKFEFPESLVSKRLPIGLTKVIRQTDQARMKAFYDAWYRPENMILVIVGDFDPKQTVGLIQETFDSMTPRAAAKALPDIGNIDHKGLKAFYHYEKEAGNTTIGIERLEKVMREPDSLEYQKRMLLKNLADRIVQHRLNRLVSKANSPVTDASVYSGLQLQEIVYAEISTECRPENWRSALELTEQTLRRAVQYGFTNAEVARVKKEVLAEMDKAVKGAKTRTSGAIASAVIWHLNNDRVLQSPEQEKNLFEPFIQSITAESLHEAFKSSWVGDSRLFLVTGNALIQPEPARQILDVVKKSMAAAVTKPKQKQSMVFPYLSLPTAGGEIRERKEDKELGIVTIDFKNGARLNLKKTDFKADEFVFALRFGNGRSIERKEQAGISLMAEAVLNESGTGTLTKEGLEEALAGKNTSLSFQFGEEDMMLAGSSVPQEAELVFQLLSTLIQDPGFKSEAYQLVKERYQQRYESLSHSIEGAMELSGARFLAGGDHRFGLPPQERFFENQLSDIETWVRAVLAEGKFELSIVGDFDLEPMIELAGRYLGNLASRTQSPPSPVVGGPVFPKGKALEIKVPTKIPRGLVDVVFETDDFWNIRQTRRLVLLSEIFSDMMRVRIREKLGATYSPFAFNKPSRVYDRYGLFHAMVQVAPAEAEKVRAEIAGIAQDLIDHGITDDQFRRALDPVLTELKDARRTNSYWLRSVLIGVREHPEQLAWARSMLVDFASAKKEDVATLAKQYLINQQSATLIIKPAEPAKPAQ